MPIYKGTLKTGAAYKGSTSLSRIYKGAYLVFEAFKTLIAEGVPPLTLLNCISSVLLGYKIYGNSTQSGTPAPDNPVEIESVGDKTKNLFDYKYFFNNKTDGAGVIASTNDAVVYILKPNTNYTVSTNYPKKTASTAGSLAAVFFAKSGNYTPPNTTDDGLWEGQTRTITTDTEGRLFIACRNSKSTVPAPTIEEFSSGQYWIQLEEGSTATSYEPYGYRIPVKTASPNLLPYPYTLETSTQGGIEVTVNDDGSIKLNGTSTGLSTTFNTFRLKAGTYTISGNPSPDVNLWLRVVGSMSSADYVRNYNGIKGTLTIAEDSDMYVYITVTKGITLDNVIIYPMVNEGKTDLEYSKYFAPETTNIYLDEPLRKIGNYIDYIDFETGKVYRNVKKINLSTTLPQFNFSTSWDNEDYTTCYFRASDIGFSGIMSNYFKSGTSYQSNVYDNQIVANYGNTYIYIKIAKAIATNKTELNNWLNTLSTPVEIIYQLASTTEESIELPDILLNKGTNIISVDTSVQPSNMWIKYKSK